MKIYARQVNPAYQESPLYLFDEWPEDMAITGNRDYYDHVPPVFQTVYEALEKGELYDELELLASRDENAWYKNATAAIMDYLSPEHKKRYSTREISALKKLVRAYGEGSASADDRILCDVLSIVTGKRWDHRTISGTCQGEWQDVFYIVENWSDKALECFEMEYFNTGYEYIVHDEDAPPAFADDISGYSIYCYSWNDDGIRQEIADAAGCSPEDVILFDYDSMDAIEPGIEEEEPETEEPDTAA